MENNFNFKSQICTDKLQSERLLALGLNKETADMCSVIDHVSDGGKWEEVDTIFSFTPDDWNFRESVTPRWSLHRLIILIGNIACDWIFRNDDCYTNAISCIEWLIKKGYFNKEYLV